MKKKTLFLLSFLLFSYWGVWNGFFQQDEWAGLGNFYVYRDLEFPNNFVSLFKPLLSNGLGHFTPLTLLVNLARYSLFDQNFALYTIFSLIVHGANVVLVYIFAKKLFPDNVRPFVAALLFSVFYAGHEAVTWIATSVPTQGATLFFLLALIFWFNWLEKQKRKWLFLSIISVISAVLFKETAVVLFAILPLATFIYKPNFPKKVLIIFSFGPLLYFVLRVILTDFMNAVQFVLVSVGRVFDVVLRGFAQLIFPANVARNQFEIDSHLYSFYVVAGIGLLILSAVVIYKIKKQKEKQIMIFSLLLLIISISPLIFLPETEFRSAILASRHLYLASVGGVLLITSVVWSLFYTRKFLMMVIIASVVLMNMLAIRNHVHDSLIVAQERKKILDNIQSEYPNLPDKVVFFISSDNYYYGLDVATLPFQSGFGQTLLVTYHPTEKFPTKYFRDRFLWEIRDQGYKEIDNRGFGFYRNWEDFKNEFENKKFIEDSIISFSYDSKNQTLRNTTSEIKKQISQ